jgi:hypothetical protein
LGCWPISPGTIVSAYATKVQKSFMAVDTALVLSGPKDWSDYDDSLLKLP